MKIISIFFEMLFLFIKSLLNQPALLFLLILAISANKLYPKFRGFMGEFWVKTELRKLSKKEYIILNDIMLEDKFGTHQIDHVVMSKYGIFVIEMKNYYGTIVGDEYKSNWIQYLGKNKYYFKNPIHQNYGHLKALEGALGIANDFFIPIICFSNQAKLKVKTKSIVIQLDDLNNAIKAFHNIQFNYDINLFKEKLISLNITDKLKRKMHVKNIKEKIRKNNK